jgi:hypothetical protein
MKHLSVQRSRRDHSALSLREMEYDTGADRKFSHEINSLPKATEFTFPEVKEFMLSKVIERTFYLVTQFICYLKSQNSYGT